MIPIKKVIDRKKKKMAGEPVWKQHFTCDDYYGLAIQLHEKSMTVGNTAFYDLSPEYMDEYLRKQKAMIETVRYALEMHKTFYKK